MKRILALVSVLMTAAACTAPTENANQPTNTNTAAVTRTTAVPLTEADAIAKEKAAWDAIKNKDYDAFANMLADDQILVVADGVHDKAGSVDGVKSFDLTDVTFSDWKFVSVDKDAAVITYTATSKGKMNGKDLPPDTSRHSSAWVNRNGKWVSIYHQESVVKKPPPPPPANAKPKTATSPATAPATPAAIVTSADAEANEKAIWGALKMRNLDGFASALAPESIEVEPDGVFDKAGSMKMLNEIDLSKATVSDFKTIKFDDDASLVTYMVKVPGGAPNGEQHSTVWVHRNGKWLALFHQGTIVVPAPAAAAKPSASPSAKAATSPAAKPAATK